MIKMLAFDITVFASVIAIWWWKRADLAHAKERARLSQANEVVTPNDNTKRYITSAVCGPALVFAIFAHFPFTDYLVLLACVVWVTGLGGAVIRAVRAKPDPTAPPTGRARDHLNADWSPKIAYWKEADAVVQATCQGRQEGRPLVGYSCSVCKLWHVD